MTAPTQGSTSVWVPFVTLAEKVFYTYVQAVIALVIVGLSAGKTFNFTAVQIAAVAGIPAALTVVANGMPGVPVGLPFVQDMLFRVVRTYVVSFAGFLIAAPTFSFNYSVAAAASAAAIPAVLTVLKAQLAGHFGQVGTPAFLPAHLDASASAPAVVADHGHVGAAG